MKNLHFSHNNKKFLKNFSGATLIELMVMIAVVSLALTTMFVSLTQTINFSYDTESRIKAVNLAREGIEAVTNIRNTNWLRYSSDRKNCWDSFNYNTNCFSGRNKIENGKYILIDTDAGTWNLEKIDTFANTDTKVYIDGNGWYYQANWRNDITERCKNIAPITSTTPELPSTNCVTNFTREIEISDKTENSMTVNVTVSWRNNLGKRKVNIISKLENWKANYDRY